jgi:hypothetical protein
MMLDTLCPKPQQAPPRNVACVIDAASCLHHAVSYSAEHHALFRKLVVSLVHARSVLEVERIKTQSLGAPKEDVRPSPLMYSAPVLPHTAVPLARDDVRKFLQQDFLQDDAFERYVRENAPKREWKYLLSIPAHLRYRVGDMAIVHYEVWRWLQENSKIASPAMNGYWMPSLS